MLTHFQRNIGPELSSGRDAPGAHERVVRRLQNQDRRVDGAQERSATGPSIVVYRIPKTVYWRSPQVIKCTEGSSLEESGDINLVVQQVRFAANRGFHASEQPVLVDS